MVPRRVLLLVFIGVAALFMFGCMSQQARAALLSGPYAFSVDYSQSLEDSLRAGHYSWVNSQVTSSNFPGAQAGGGSLSAVLVAFPPQASLEYVMGRQVPAGMRPATLKELLAFGAAYPDVQRKVPVLALGSSADLKVNTYEHMNDSGMVLLMRVVPQVERVYPFLSGGLPGRIVGLEWLDDPGGYGMYYALFVQSK